MICKVCGNQLEKKERFCPYCGSYFIDASVPDDGLEWKGVINPDGTIENQANVNAYKRRSSGSGQQEIYTPVKPPLVWSLLGLISSSIVFILMIADMIADGVMFLLAIPFFIFGIIAVSRAERQKMKWISILLLFLSVVLFVIRVNG